MSCEHYRKSLLRYLMIKTAGVRAGVKPGTLLRVARCCYLKDNTRSEKICIYQDEILAELKLDFRILKRDPESALVLFYNPCLLEKTLNGNAEANCLARYGYPESTRAAEYLDHLEKRCAEFSFPHEVGLFLGYPLKDVTGFIEKAPRTLVKRGDWQVFGDPRESLCRMRLYRWVEHLAEKIIENCQDFESCLEKIGNINITQTAGS